MNVPSPSNAFAPKLRSNRARDDAQPGARALRPAVKYFKQGLCTLRRAYQSCPVWRYDCSYNPSYSHAAKVRVDIFRASSLYFSTVWAPPSSRNCSRSPCGKLLTMPNTYSIVIPQPSLRIHVWRRQSCDIAVVLRGAKLRSAPRCLYMSLRAPSDAPSPAPFIGRGTPKLFSSTSLDRLRDARARVRRQAAIAAALCRRCRGRR